MDRWVPDAAVDDLLVGVLAAVLWRVVEGRVFLRDALAAKRRRGVNVHRTAAVALGARSHVVRAALLRTGKLGELAFGTRRARPSQCPCRRGNGLGRRARYHRRAHLDPWLEGRRRHEAPFGDVVEAVAKVGTARVAQTVEPARVGGVCSGDFDGHVWKLAALGTCLARPSFHCVGVVDVTPANRSGHERRLRD